MQSFWSEGAALLLVCPGEGLPEPRGWRPRIIRCLLPQNKGVSFNLAGKLREDMGKDVPSGTSHTCWLGEMVREEANLLMTRSEGVISDHRLQEKGFFSHHSIPEKEVG